MTLDKPAADDGALRLLRMRWGSTADGSGPSCISPLNSAGAFVRPRSWVFRWFAPISVRSSLRSPPHLWKCNIGGDPRDLPDLLADDWHTQLRGAQPDAS